MSPRFTDKQKHAPRRHSQTTRSSADGATQLRKSVEGLTGIGAGSRKTSHTLKRVGRILLGLVLVAAFCAALYLVAWKAEFVGGKTIPDIEGYLVSRAEQVLEKDGFTSVSIAETETDEVQEGIVLSVSPEPGTRIDETSSVVLEVAKKPSADEAGSSE